MVSNIQKIQLKQKLKTLINLHNLRRISQSNYDISSTVLVIGVPRSGTSWFGEIVSQLISARTIFEPTRWDQTPFDVFQDPKLVCIDENEKNSEYQSALECIFTGKIPLNYFIDKDNNPDIYQTRVVKEVRFSWILPYIRTTFPELTIIYIIRNPFSTLLSQESIKHPDQLDISRKYYQQVQLHPVIKRSVWSRYGSLPINSDDFMDYKIATWSATQRYVINYLEHQQNIGLCIYEDMVDKFDKFGNGLQHYLEANGFTPISLENVNSQKPSRTTLPSRQKAVKSRQKHKWKSELTDRQINRYYEIMKHFDIHTLYEEDGTPNEYLRSRSLAMRV